AASDRRDDEREAAGGTDLPPVDLEGATALGGHGSQSLADAIHVRKHVHVTHVLILDGEDDIRGWGSGLRLWQRGIVAAGGQRRDQQHTEQPSAEPTSARTMVEAVSH